MRIIGIDPGLKVTGYGIIECRNNEVRLLETGIIQPKLKDVFPKRINAIYLSLIDIVRQFKPQVLVLEKLYAHHKHPATASIIGHARAVPCLICAQENIELHEHSVKRIRKSVTGNGNATKIQTRRVVCSVLKLDETKLTLDASDALALALGFVNMNRLKI